MFNKIKFRSTASLIIILVLLFSGLSLSIASAQTEDERMIPAPERPTTGEMTFIVGEEAIRRKLDELGKDLDQIMQSGPSSSSSSVSSYVASEPMPQPNGLGGHLGIFQGVCRGPVTAYHLFTATTGPWAVIFQGSTYIYGGYYCSGLQCLVMASAPVPSGDILFNYNVGGVGQTIDHGGWCS